MSAPLDLYPLSTADGEAVPLDVIAPTGYMYIKFSSVATSVLPLPATSDMIVLNADEDCIISFANVVADFPAERTFVPDVLFLRKSMQVIVYPQKKFISVKRLRLDGTLHLQFIDTWHGLALATQYEKG